MRTTPIPTGPLRPVALADKPLVPAHALPHRTPAELLVLARSGLVEADEQRVDGLRYATAHLAASSDEVLASLDKFLLLDVRRAGAYEASKSVIAGATWRDPDGAIQASLQFLGVPDTIFIDARGLARTTVPGPIDPEQLQRELRAILPGDQPSG